MCTLILDRRAYNSNHECMNHDSNHDHVQRRTVWTLLVRWAYIFAPSKCQLLSDLHGSPWGQLVATCAPTRKNPHPCLQVQVFMGTGMGIHTDRGVAWEPAGGWDYIKKIVLLYSTTWLHMGCKLSYSKGTYGA